MNPSKSSRTVGLQSLREHDACGVGFIACATGERSHTVVKMALQALGRVAHRGAAATDNSGDGAGLLTQIPTRFFHREAYRLGLGVQPGFPFAVGAFFLPRKASALAVAIELIEQVMLRNGLPVLGWREVPVEPAALGPLARESCPVIRQIFVGRPAVTDDDAWERVLYLARRDIEKEARSTGLTELYVCSLSCRTIVYKALLVGTQLASFYTDLRFPEFETAIAVFHQRYSTNTLPSWPLAQPFRMIAHNGEINTLWGNRNAMAAREADLGSPVWGNDIERLKPVIWPEGATPPGSTTPWNSWSLGRTPMQHHDDGARAWEQYPDVEPAIRDFYRFHAEVVEPWDGPAALAFSDGIVAGAATDRNGLRPCRYKVTRDHFVIAGSEVGLVDLDPAEVLESGKLGPCEFIVVDVSRGRVLRNMDVKREVASRQPYGRWARENLRLLLPDLAAKPESPDAASLAPYQVSFGYGHEDLRFVLQVMATQSQDTIWSMGDDTPIPPLSRLPQSVYAFFRQRFAQVTNPPIDPLRESVVMSLRQHLGRHGSFLMETPRMPDCCGLIASCSKRRWLP
jgi:glutamate synthase domain-containing protein 1